MLNLDSSCGSQSRPRLKQLGLLFLLVCPLGGVVYALATRTQESPDSQPRQDDQQLINHQTLKQLETGQNNSPPASATVTDTTPPVISVSFLINNQVTATASDADVLSYVSTNVMSERARAKLSNETNL